jgi:hypothetical protein
MIAGLTMNELVNRAATRSAAIRPADLAVSLAPWLAASQAEVTYCPARTGPAARDRRSGEQAQGGPLEEVAGDGGSHRRHCQRDQDSDHSDRFAGAQATPVDGARPGIEQGGPEQAADQGMRRARRDR